MVAKVFKKLFFSYTINIGANPISLTQIDFISGLEVNAGSVATNFWKWDLDITTTGSETPVASQTTFARSGNNTAVQHSETATLSGLENLSNVDVTFAFTGFYGVSSDYSGGQNTNRFVYMDNVTFTGVDAVPEPSAALLGGLGMLFLLRRRR